MNKEQRLKKEYDDKFKKELQDELKLENKMAVPTVDKIVVNVGLGAAKDDPKVLEEMAKDITDITGQKPLITKSKRAISNFKVKEGAEIGLKVTLRGRRMWDFLDKLIRIALPRVKDFRGVPLKSFDGRGNYALGIREHTVFIEVDSNNITKIRSLQVIVNTTAGNDNDGRVLLRKLGMPFVKEIIKNVVVEEEVVKEEPVKKEEKN